MAWSAGLSELVVRLKQAKVFPECVCVCVSIYLHKFAYICAYLCAEYPRQGVGHKTVCYTNLRNRESNRGSGEKKEELILGILFSPLPGPAHACVTRHGNGGRW